MNGVLRFICGVLFVLWEKTFFSSSRFINYASEHLKVSVSWRETFILWYYIGQKVLGTLRVWFSWIF